MFSTDKDAEIQFLSNMAPEGRQVWSYVHLDVHNPWIYVEYAMRNSEYSTTAMLLLNSVEQLCDLSNRSDITLTQVYLISPSYLNKTSSWQMNSVAQITKATQVVRKIKTPILIYKFRDGRELQSGVINKNKIRDFEIIFSHNTN